MKIAISGASGYIGQHLTLFFTEKGDEVVRKEPVQGGEFR